MDDTPATICLVADIGGTHARFALAQALGGSVQLHHQTVFRCADFDGVQQALKRYLGELDEPPPAQACLAIAAPVVGDRVEMTNRSWRFSISTLRSELGLQRLDVINDFAAQAMALPHLQADDQLFIKPITETAGLQTRAILGPGTGLGVAMLIHDGQRWLPVPGQGGHVSLPIETSQEQAIYNRLHQEHGAISAETVLSGNGLVRLHRAMTALDSGGEVVLEAADITRRALLGEPDCRATVKQFARFLAMMAGNVALTAGATGGVYLAGGIAPRIEPFLCHPDFQSVFHARGSQAEYLRPIPIALITHPNPALIGACAWSLACGNASAAVSGTAGLPPETTASD